MILRLALFSLCATACHAQTNTATLNGVVREPPGGVLAGVTGTAVSEGTGVRTATVTNDAELYSIPNLAVGEYKLTLEKPGFQKQARNGIALTTGQILEWNATLEPG